MVTVKMCACGCGGSPSKGRFLQGHQWTDPEIREKRAVKLRGRPLTDEHRRKLSLARTGVVFSDERRQAVAEGRIAGYTKPYYLIEDRGHETPCWVWARALLKTGYGAIRRGGKNYRAHRWMYEQIVGPITPGLVLDHLCCVKACVRPDHLEQVTKRENERRAAARKRAEQRAA